MRLLEDGQTIRDMYEVERLLGEGAFAEVYRVRHRYLGKQALKLIRTPGLSAGEIDKLLVEAALLCRIEHPNIVRVYDAGSEVIDEHLHGYFTMEYVAGGSLDSFWRSYEAHFIPVPIALNLMTQVCRGLAFAHRQQPPIIHRDIKPLNILIKYDSGGLIAKISDFGLALRVNPSTRPANGGGTLAFTAPEGFLLPRHDSSAGDVWAFGVTLYLLLTNKMPFAVPDENAPRGEDPFRKPFALPSSLNPGCDRELDRIVATCLAVDPCSRYNDAGELLEELERWVPRPDRDRATQKKTAALPPQPRVVSLPRAGLGRGLGRDLGRDHGRDHGRDLGRDLACQAVALAQSSQHLNEAAELMEKAFRELPALSQEYRGRVKLWRRGIAM